LRQHSKKQATEKKAAPAGAGAKGTHQAKKQSKAAQQSVKPEVNRLAARRLWKVQREGLTVGLDIGDKYSHICVLNEEAEVIKRDRVKTTSQALHAYFGSLPGSTRVAMEAGTHSPWISRVLELLSMEVIVGQPRLMPQIHRSSRKNDRVDAEKLARTARLDPNSMGPIQHRSAEMQADLGVIRARAAAVEARTKLINTVRGLVKTTGQRLAACSAESFVRTATPLAPGELRAAVAPLLEAIEKLDETIKGYDKVVARLCEQYRETELLQQVGGVGTLTSLTFVLTIADPQRFGKSRDVGPYLGLVPGEKDSGEQHPELGISKAGNSYLRRLLVTSAQYILGPFGPECDLRRLGQRLMADGEGNDKKSKKRKKRAVVAVARRLAILLHKLWITGEVYEPDYAASKVACAAA
jgi:transposase